MSREMVSLVCQRADEMRMLAPGTDMTSYFCAKCEAQVGVAPSGQRIIAAVGIFGVEITCNRCFEATPGAVGIPAPGALAEVPLAVKNPGYVKKKPTSH